MLQLVTPSAFYTQPEEVPPPPNLKDISMVSSTLEYDCVIWDPFRKEDIDKINQIHRSAARFLVHQTIAGKLVFPLNAQITGLGGTPDQTEQRQIDFIV